jgi:RimJ/RimL family protein N-acetyltransferase
MLSLRKKSDDLAVLIEWAEAGEAVDAEFGTALDALDAEVPGDWPPEGIADAMALFAAQLRRDPALAGWLSWYWLRVDPASGRRTLIGSGGFTSPPVDGAVAIGYSLLPACRGRGYATEAVRALAAWAFDHPEVLKVIAETLAGNEPSIRVLLRAGFRRAKKASEPGHLRFVLKRL